MSNQGLRILGLMSGSSLDGLDIALCHFRNDQWTIEKGETKSFSTSLKQSLAKCHGYTALDLWKTEVEFTRFCAESIEVFLQGVQIDLIVSHGHTVYHSPREFISHQIGNGGLLSSLTSTNVLCDLRIQDIGKGREGAPLAPVVDRLFSQYEATLNLGGIANVSYQGKGGRDLCPCNQLLNHIVGPLNIPYDDEGRIGRTGTPVPKMISRWKNVEFHKSEQTSLGNHEVQNQWIDKVDPDMSIAHQSASALHYITDIVSADIIKSLSTGSRVLVTGGGAHHTYLIELLTNKLKTKGIELVIPPKDIINYKECLLMAYMGYLYLMDEPNIPNDDIIAGALYRG